MRTPPPCPSPPPAADDGSRTAADGGERAEDRQVASVWIPLTDVDGDTGALYVLPASHQLGRVPTRTVSEKYGHLAPILDAVPADEPGVALPMARGDVLVFGNLFLHRTGPMASPDHIRWSIDLRYSAADQPFDWARPDFKEIFPCFTASGSGVQSWEEWSGMWQRKWAAAAL